MPNSDQPDIDDSDEPTPAHGGRFVPMGFEPPTPPLAESFWLEPLGPQHNEADYVAWTSSMEHIHATPGFTSGRWPHQMTLEQNLGDLQMHARHFERSQGFTYTVRSRDDDDVVGCVYIYPSHDATVDASVRSWVRVSVAELDVPLWRYLSDWLDAQWPFTVIDYAPR